MVKRFLRCLFCPHERYQHGRFVSACKEDGCGCNRFVSPEEDRYEDDELAW
jgi:hypothetical protein